ncbi:hypothetical protein ATJ97_2433 [Georgenia soli]|uniref:DUF4440 domain-containing protein n=1 Tax=Georgenia soli TaxID=638953 RepID=A0A2A9EM81_9MICO|nr:DUF4440 domain-containing protein [Georgenia soli]PFG39913.1 hypothetical protein ATJ97_2433 [Georgenia soli]
MDAGAVGQVIILELALLSPEVRRCPGRVEELLDPDFLEIGTSGRLWTRAAVVAALAEGTSDDDAAIEAIEMSGAVVAPGLVLLTYVSDPCGRAARRSSLWRCSEGAWRLLHHQGMPLPAS